MSASPPLAHVDHETGDRPIHASWRWAIMDTQTKREIWLLAIGTTLVEAPGAMIAYAILTH